MIKLIDKGNFYQYVDNGHLYWEYIGNFRLKKRLGTSQEEPYCIALSDNVLPFSLFNSNPRLVSKESNYAVMSDGDLYVPFELHKVPDPIKVEKEIGILNLKALSIQDKFVRLSKPYTSLMEITTSPIYFSGGDSFTLYPSVGTTISKTNQGLNGVMHNTILTNLLKYIGEDVVKVESVSNGDYCISDSSGDISMYVPFKETTTDYREVISGWSKEYKIVEIIKGINTTKLKTLLCKNSYIKGNSMALVNIEDKCLSIVIDDLFKIGNIPIQHNNNYKISIVLEALILALNVLGSAVNLYIYRDRYCILTDGTIHIVVGCMYL